MTYTVILEFCLFVRYEPLARLTMKDSLPFVPQAGMTLHREGRSWNIKRVAWDMESDNFTVTFDDIERRNEHTYNIAYDSFLVEGWKDVTS